MERNKCYTVTTETGEKKQVWDGRYTCVCGMVFAGDSQKRINVLANKRGPGCPKEVGKWNLPCGFLDAGTGEYNVSREVFEETGILVPPEEFRMIGIKLDDKERNVTIRYIAGLEEMVEPTTVENLTGEPDEVEEIRWIPLEDLDKYEWAFNHDTVIKKFVDLIMKQE